MSDGWRTSEPNVTPVDGIYMGESDYDERTSQGEGDQTVTLLQRHTVVRLEHRGYDKTSAENIKANINATYFGGSVVGTVSIESIGGGGFNVLVTVDTPSGIWRLSP